VCVCVCVCVCVLQTMPIVTELKCLCLWSVVFSQQDKDIQAGGLS